jgi:hypothetical protein
MVVDYAAGQDSFSASKEPAWSNQQLPELIRSGSDGWRSDLSPDWKRFIVFPMPEGDRQAASSVHAYVLLNFFDELRRRVR